MRPMFATFTHPEHAKEFARTLRRRVRAVSMASVEAFGDGEKGQLVLAYVKDSDLPWLRQLAVEAGGVARKTARVMPSARSGLSHRERPG